MSKIILLAFTLSLITGCAATKIADEYGSNTVTAIFACPGVNWASKKLDETFCLMQSKDSPNEYILGEDTAETYGDAVLAGLTLGLSLIFDGDIQEKWFAAAKEFTAETYGEKARVINFRQNLAAYKGYAFEVLE
tara:strand:- start:62 stop:466 length:405 start_codon:yes stop_codon:yes gene_type:complete